jgi:SAM-dependent methyltransferase
MARAPTSVLDVGVGYGKYGHLLREYLDDYRWEVRIDGVDAHPYMQRVGCGCYDQLFHGDFLTIDLPHYDLVLMIDVLEHFDRDDGFASLRKAATVGTEVLISTPHRPRPQAAVNGNPYERHRSRWTAADFAGYTWGPASTRQSLIGILSRAPQAGTR